MSWPTALALFYLSAAVPIAWHHARELLDELAPGVGVNIAGDLPVGLRHVGDPLAHTGLPKFR
ncbi:hypothetical protein L2K20_29115 [Mycobacterium sp. MBM]|nr:hypothetical protein [Mycobacterium sp. MBM]